MPLRANAIMTFEDYTIRDFDILFHFVCTDPGPGQNTDYYAVVTKTELAAISTAVQLRNLLTTRLQENLRASGIASKLDNFIGQTITV